MRDLYCVNHLVAVPAITMVFYASAGDDTECYACDNSLGGHRGSPRRLVGAAATKSTLNFYASELSPITSVVGSCRGVLAGIEDPLERHWYDIIKYRVCCLGDFEEEMPSHTASNVMRKCVIRGREEFSTVQHPRPSLAIDP